MSCGIHKALWVVVTIIISICDLLDLCIRKLKALCMRSYDSIFHGQGSYEIDYLERCKPELTKIPKHLSIVVGPDSDTDSEILSKIAAYALIMDIDYISFFDVRGVFSLEQVHVPKFISSKKMRNGHFLWSMPGDRSKTAQLKYRNGLEKSIEVAVLSKNDGKALIAEVCRDLFEKRNTTEIQEALKDRPSLTNIISKSLQKKLNNMTDPDCAIIFSNHMCTYGLLPWHTGFTEFHLIKTGSYFSVETFARVLYRFSKCEQRYGH
ncbi:dehydrodolichyl diphosphate synthase complex subunit nus1 [Eupeodes corollae]|uniref:dehydrodolichyl diphosphate synthase complex subunit nus1 n=1 Tax=Eupeodes corollae TaxID=290404 RepID=UPI00248FDD0C|nr:dehydrodolichyl diphosphate synthase complex subunit nus1 [Eupeodes corollae]XP_055917347.1 dehydrodolichyl diphosphate synthase complex subunit nus1 [Eupeodes corollae]